VLASPGPARPAAAPTAEDCLACHADRGLTREAPERGRSASVFVDATALEASTHAGLDCVSCHAGATAPHDARLPAVRCADCHDGAPAALAGGAHGSAAARAARRAPTCAGCHGTHGVRPAASAAVGVCGACHTKQVELYRSGIHGRLREQGTVEAATCASCHGATHGALRKSDRRAPTYHLNLPRTCAECHADPELTKRREMRTGLYQSYMDSIHGRAVTRSGLLVAANCSDCHDAHDIRPRTEPASRVYRANIPETCGSCHAGVTARYDESIHGRLVAAGSTRAPVCTDCHSAHQIRRVEGAPWQLEAIRECGTCHQESLRTFRDTFHGKVTVLGLTRVAKCADCHGSHDIQPIADARSRVAPGNLVATCAQCHPGATAKFAQFSPHADPTMKDRFPWLYWTNTLMMSLLVGTFAFFGLHTLLWLPRSLMERLRRGRGGEAERPGA
jgi:nitrate/TMAO reductase-like tetraheme cytochrome c subunit